MRDSDAYKTYLAYATGAASPKMKRKLKKPASSSKKRTLVTVDEEEPEPAKKALSSKKLIAKRQSAGGIELLSDVALLEEDQLKKALRRSKRETTIHQACGSRVPDVSKADSSKSENESWGDNGDEANEQSDDERTESDYVPTNDETNDESNDVTEEEYERINEELYGDVNVSLTDVEPADKEKDDVEMIVVGHVNVNQEGAVISMMDINVQHEVPRTSSLLTIPVFVIPEQDVINQSETVTTSPAPTISSLISSLYPALQQISPIPTPTTTEATTSTIVVPDTETLTALHQRIDDLEKDVKELKDVDNSTKVISTIQSEFLKAVKEYLGSSLDDAMHKVIQKNVADIIKEHFVLAETVERLRQQYAPQKNVEDIREIKIEHARKQQVPKETITSSDTTALAKFDQKTTLFETMTISKSFNKSLKQRALYHALMELILEDKDVMDEGVAYKLKKRKPDDAD
ncbi:hypothetical protein Tco_0940160 [Tanacetum coccineum]|uniref:Uncharacterized protein n=1 Tax=Tanacetum coccineum TaxID=301880 RepID=A0ABQ5DM80_9ASTR